MAWKPNGDRQIARNLVVSASWPKQRRNNLKISAHKIVGQAFSVKRETWREASKSMKPSSRASPGAASGVTPKMS
jgi:hypothetical protein